MGERIMAMLSESGLPHSFWGECVASMVHVWNRIPTTPLLSTTPYKAFYKHKPDVSSLRVWGCAAPVHIQRDQRTSLEPHMQKCMFIGYPPGYKAWKFYNPVTQKVIISEQADFDERYFPGLSRAKINALPPYLPLLAPSSFPGRSTAISASPTPIPMPKAS